MADVPGQVDADDFPLPERYSLGELVGRGAVADVFHAYDRILGRPVAVKVFRAHADQVARRRFIDEGCALTRLAHPNLVSIFDAGIVRDHPYLVMELIDGPSLQSRLMTGPLSVGEVMRLGRLVADALAHAHDRGVVHRDVKPSNILFDQDGTPHLVDFGIALVTGRPRLTDTNQVVGTPAYLSPEQVLGDEFGSAVDIYSLGLVLLEGLTGQRQYTGATKLQAALARLNRPPRIPPDLPHGLTDLMAAMTDSHPEYRPTALRCAQRLTVEQHRPARTCRLSRTDPFSLDLDSAASRRTSRKAGASGSRPVHLRFVKRRWRALVAAAIAAAGA